MAMMDLGVLGSPLRLQKKKRRRRRRKLRTGFSLQWQKRRKRRKKKRSRLCPSGGGHTGRGGRWDTKILKMKMMKMLHANLEVVVINS